MLELQRSAGNRAVTQLVAAGRRASSERPTPVDSQTQAAIDSARDHPSPGQWSRRFDRADVTLHAGGRIDPLTTRLGARAFTQGKDIFLRSEQLLQPALVAATLAHELTHVAQGGVSAGAVLKDEDAEMKAALDEDSTYYVGERELNRELQYIMESTPRPQAVVMSHPSSGGERPNAPTLRPKDGAAPPPPTPEVPQTFDLDFVIDHQPLSFTGLSLQGAVKALNKVWSICHGVRENYRDMHAELLKNREDHPIVGFWADKLGHGDPPPLTMWHAIGAFELSQASAAINAIPLTEDQAYKEYEAGEAEVNRNAAMNYDVFLGSELQARKTHAEDVFTRHITRAADQLQKAANLIDLRRRSVFYYKSGQEIGAARGVKVTEAAIDTLEFAATAGVAGEVRGGLFVKSLVTSGTQAGLGMYTEAAKQTGEMIYGGREWFDWDLKRIADVGARQAVQGFVGAVVGGSLSRLIKGSAGLLLTKMGIGKVENKALVLAGDLITDWLSAEGSVPFQHAAGLLVDRVEGNPQSFTGWGDFFSQSWDAMTGDAAYNVFMTGLGRAVATSHEPTTSDTGGTAPPPEHATPGPAEPVRTGGGGPPHGAPVADVEAGTARGAGLGAPEPRTRLEAFDAHRELLARDVGAAFHGEVVAADGAATDIEVRFGGADGPRRLQQATDYLDARYPGWAKESRLKLAAAAAPARSPRAMAAVRALEEGPSREARHLAARFAPLYADWPTLTVPERLARLVAPINEDLRVVGAPDVFVKDRAGEGGRLSMQTWEIEIGEVALSNPTPAKFAEICGYVAHEGRHAIQMYRIARVRTPPAGELHPDVLKAAAAANAREGMPDPTHELAYAEAIDFYESVWGTGKPQREAILTRVDNAGTALERAIADAKKAERYSRHELIRRVAEHDLAIAREEFDSAHDAYMGLAEESDAWRRGKQTEAAIKERLGLERSLAAARQAESHALTAYRRAEASYVAIAAKPGHHLSLPTLEAYERALARWQAAANKAEKLDEKLVSLATKGTLR
jgi:hypothetical protein